MSAGGDAGLAKLAPTEKTEIDSAQTSKTATSQPPALLEEDDEFEDFPVEDWTQEDTEVPGGSTHLWEESWDDDDENEDFSKQLKEELKKVEATKS
ncbi:26S proteasome complex subunit [Elasticomyces elasticus]|uniref:26S proteasome complex subunit SEM1 n=1 Tax=Exophiala sideris TaxID=1016849 RepID=A0ABR0JDH9_9EURO|nr:26S proteasome complex subunit [Elasticomyces elasticus]KAK5031756.1 26S proteasome complex subunit [Exophiala sideris]KAK5040685.1 26S proteasome complex subunit [Exophiala sideris]KAK5061981.1 26S proteasome complex subunit [Exophiala sideris]KAK5184681.1 26S proteasome complex subunit [Eurotiomycetes sp. CCFEE 6388]